MSHPERKNMGTSPTKHWMPMLRPRRRVIQCSVSVPVSRGPHVSLVTWSRDSVPEAEARSERYQGRYTQIRLVSSPHSTHLVLLVTTFE